MDSRRRDDKSGLVALVHGGADRVTLSAPPEHAVRNLRVLEELGLLTPSMVWEVVGHSPVDPFFFIRIIRSSRNTLGVHARETVMDSSVVFEVGEKTELGSQVAVHVDVVTNDMVIMAWSKDRYSPVYELSGMDLFRQVSVHQAGPERLAALLEAFRGYFRGAVERSLSVVDVVNSVDVQGLKVTP